MGAGFGQGNKYSQFGISSMLRKQGKMSSSRQTTENMKVHAHGFGNTGQTASTQSGLQTTRGILAEAKREQVKLQDSYKKLGFDPFQIFKSVRELVQSTAAVLRQQKATVIRAVARQLRLQTAYVIDVKGSKDADQGDIDINTTDEASTKMDAEGDKTRNLHILLSSAVLEVPTTVFVDYTDTDHKTDQQLATFTLQLLLRFEICSVLRQAGDREFGLGRHRDLAKNIAYSLAEHLRDHRFEPRFFNEILKANYGKDLYNSDLIDFKSIFLLPEESSSDNDDQPPHAPTAAIPRRCSATVVMTKNPNATGPCPVPENKRGTEMLEDKRLGAVLLRGPSRSDKAAGRSRTAGRQLTASQQDGQAEGSTYPGRGGSKRRAGHGTPQSRRKRTPPESNEIDEDNDEDAIPGTVPPQQPPNMPRFRAASQGSLRGLSLLAGLAENLQQTVEPLPDMDVNDAPVQDKDCAQLQCEDGKAGAAAGDDDAHHTDMPASPPSNAHPPELSVVPGPPLDNEPRDSEKSWQGGETGCVKVPVVMVATPEAHQLFKPLEGDSQHNATREHAAAPSSQPAQAGGHKSQPRRSRRTTKGVPPRRQLADAPVPQKQGPAQQPQPCTKAAAGKRKRETADRAKRSKRTKAEKPKEPSCQAGPAHSAQQARPSQGRVTRSAAAKQLEASSRRVTRSQGSAGQSGHAAAKQPGPSRDSQPPPDASGEVRGVDSLCRLSTIAEALEAEEEAAAVGTGPAGNGPVGLISPGTAAAAAALASLRTAGPLPALVGQGRRGGLRGPNWAALGDLTPPNPQAGPAGADRATRRSKRLAERPAGEAAAADKRPRGASQEGEAGPPPRRSGRQTRPRPSWCHV